MTYLRGLLAGVPAIFTALIFPGLFHAFRGISEQKATGLGAAVGGILESLYSPLFWVLAFTLFAVFFAASRLQSTLWRTLLFWIPTVLISLAGVTPIAALAYLWLRYRQG
jgi:hypothetical protein